MKEPARTLLFVGLDGAMFSLVKRFCENSKLPNFGKLMTEGSFAEAFPSVPTDLATNWTTIDTGAWPGTHGINDFKVHLPGEPLDETQGAMRELTRLCQAEFIWNIAEKAGRNCILLNYPTSWPPTIDKGTVVSGWPGTMKGFRLGPEAAFATETSIAARNWYGSSPIPILVSKAHGCRNLLESHSEPLEVSVPLRKGKVTSWTAEGPVVTGRIEGHHAREKYEVLVLDRAGHGYDLVLICAEKDVSRSVAALTLGMWSDWVFERFETSGGHVQGYFRFKLVELSRNAERFILHRTAVFEPIGWTYPEHISDELVENVGPFIPGFEESARYDSATNLEQIEYQADYLVKAAEYLTKHYSWDLLVAQIHIQDWMNHRWLSYMYEKKSSI